MGYTSRSLRWIGIGFSTSVQHPERFVFDLSTLCGLPVSRRCSRQAAKCLCPANILVLLGGETAQCLRRASIPVLLGGVGAYTATPGSSPLSMRLGKRRKTANRKEKRCMPESAGWGRKEKQRKVRMGLTLKNTPCRALTDRRCHPCCRPATVLPLLPKSHTNAGGGGALGSHTSPQSSWSDQNNILRKIVKLSIHTDINTALI